MKIDKDLMNLIINHENILIFSGAGVSVQSGIQDYKNSDLYVSKLDNNEYEHKDIMSRRTFDINKPLFFEYYFNFLNEMTDLKPNANHFFAKYLYDIGKLSGVVTQNIDGLYNDLIPNEKICAIHGDITKFICLKCKKEIGQSDIYFSKKGLPHSNCCKFLVKPKVVLYSENFSKKDSDLYQELLEKSDCIIVMGTELSIITHNNNVANFSGTKVLINKNEIKLLSNQNFGWYDCYSVREVDFDNLFIGELKEFIH